MGPPNALPLARLHGALIEELHVFAAAEAGALELPHRRAGEGDVEMAAVPAAVATATAVDPISGREAARALAAVGGGPFVRAVVSGSTARGRGGAGPRGGARESGQRGVPFPASLLCCRHRTTR